MRSPIVVVIVPCYNTSARGAVAIAGARSFAQQVLAVDDGSTDDTAAHLRASGCPTVTLAVNS
ncbi:MAG: glycosyltransferase, partial [Vicinamibacterales bacterium]